MEPPSPVRLFATLAGAFLFVFGLAGFFEDRSWLDYLHLASGALGLLAASAAARLYTLALSVTYIGLAVFAFGSDGWLHLAVGVLGLAAIAGSSEPRAQSAGDRA
jgi:hypothetical protein